MAADIGGVEEPVKKKGEGSQAPASTSDLFPPSLVTWDIPVDWDSGAWSYKAVDRGQGSAGGKETLPAFEAEVERDPSSVRLWVLYLDNLKHASTTGRFALYERAVRAVPRSYKIWCAYMQERVGTLAVDASVEEIEKVNNAFERCLSHLSSMPALWLLFLDFLMSQNSLTRTRRTFDRALKALPITQHYRIWEVYVPWAGRIRCPITAIAVYRRYLLLEPGKVAGYIELLKSFEMWDEVAVTLAKTLDEDDATPVDGKTHHDLWLDLCQVIAQHQKEIHSIDIESVLRSGIRKFSDQVALLWCALADHAIILGQLEKARDVFEEALASIATTHDFGIIFDAYAKFLETFVSRLMQKADADPIEVDLTLARLEALLHRGPLLASSVKLRQNPHNVIDWLNRVQLYRDDPVMTIKTFAEAVQTVDPMKAVGKVTILWIKFAEYYQLHDDLHNARQVFEKAVKARHRSIYELASVWCAWAEMELLNDNPKKALEVARRSVHRPPASHIVSPRSQSDTPQNPTSPTVRPVQSSESAYHHQRLACRQVKLWSLCTDLEENFGSLTSLKACYTKMFDLKVITPAQVLNYTASLQEKKYWEEAFRVYEMGVAAFRWPHVYDVWLAYLATFVARYGGRKLERARELFEQAVVDAPRHLAKRLYLMYGKLEEEYGLARHAISIYKRGAAAVDDPEDQYTFYCLNIAKVADFYGITRTRPIFESAIEKLADRSEEKAIPLAVALSLRFAEVERGLGETDRARAIFQHASQYCDPKNKPDFWSKWREFEIVHGNEETFRDMLRFRRQAAGTNPPPT